jgi:phosphatidylinositol-3-phosphatase
VKSALTVVLALVFGHEAQAVNLSSVQTVFVIVMENHIWAEIKGSPDAPYINHTLLPMASYGERYYNPPGLHPSLPHYLWLEAGTNFGIFDDNDPAVNHQATTRHLSALLGGKGISWKTYQEDISGTSVPLTSVNGYTPRHNPFVYFDDVTGTNNPNYAYGIAHNRPYTEFAADLAGNTVARYNFITPNLCNDGHDSCPPRGNPVRQTDDWLANEIPKILNSSAWSNRGAIFITWDEGEGSSDGPVGLMVISPLARGGGYFNNIRYTHSSLLRTLQAIFGVTPLLGDAANAADLSDLFTKYAISQAARSTNGFSLTVVGVVPGRTNFLQASSNLWVWQTVGTNVSATNSFTAVDAAASNYSRRFYRVLEVR